MLLLIIITLPLETHMVLVPGFSIQFIMFGMVALYLLLGNVAVLFRTMGQPLFLATYVFLFFAIAMEITARNASYTEIFRIGQMIVGAILIASMCRDLAALKVALYGYLLAGVWLSVVLFLTSYGTIQGAAAADFDAASRLRTEAFADNPIEANINGMAFLAGQGAVVALASSFHARTVWLRNLFMGIGLFCMIAAFLPLSRGGVAITLISCASVMYAYGLRQGKVILMGVLLGGVLLILVPQSVWSRMSFSFEAREGKVEGRALVYGAAIDHLPEYFVTGVGSGNFWSSWARSNEFGGHGGASGAHNAFLQVTLYWGIGGLLTFLLILWQGYRCIPRSAQREAAALGLIGIGVSLLLFSGVVHNLYAKEFCLGLGLLAGSRCWIWSNGIVPITHGQKLIS
jgi:hypothetical protein